MDTTICVANVQSTECQKNYISRQNDPFCSAKGVVLQCKRGFFALLNDNFRMAKKPLLMF